MISARVKILEAYVRSRLLYSAQSWELSALEIIKIELIWHGVLRNMVHNDFKRKNVPNEYLKTHRKERSKKSKQDVPVPEDLSWSFVVYTNDQLRTITKTSNIAVFCNNTLNICSMLFG